MTTSVYLLSVHPSLDEGLDRLRKAFQSELTDYEICDSLTENTDLIVGLCTSDNALALQAEVGANHCGRLLAFMQKGAAIDAADAWPAGPEPFLVQPYDSIEELLLQFYYALTTWAMTVGLAPCPKAPKGSALPKVFDLGPKRPYYLIYGRRSTRPRKTFGSLETQEAYTDAVLQNTYNPEIPKVRVEPEVPGNLFMEQGLMLLSGPPTSDCSMEYFDQLRKRGVELFSGSCTNHLGEECSEMGDHCAPDRQRGATGCAWINDYPAAYASKNTDPPVSVAMIVRTPTPYRESPDAPKVIFSAGCHSESGLLACERLTDEAFMAAFLAKMNEDQADERPAHFAAILTHQKGEQPVVRVAGYVDTSDKDWKFEPFVNRNQAPSKADVLIVVATKTELHALLDVTGPTTVEHGEMCTYRRVSRLIGGARVSIVQTEMGSGGPGASVSVVTEAAADIEMTSVVMVGIACGLRPDRQNIGNVLVSKQIQQYQIKRVGTTQDGSRGITPRGDKVTASTALLNRFRASAAGRDDVEFGLLLSGDVLIDNLEYRQSQQALEPEAIGVDMEAAGLYSAAHDKHLDWIVVKAICDFGDGNKGLNKAERQKTAARKSAEFVCDTLTGGGFVAAT